MPQRPDNWPKDLRFANLYPGDRVETAHGRGVLLGLEGGVNYGKIRFGVELDEFLRIVYIEQDEPLRKLSVLEDLAEAADEGPLVKGTLVRLRIDTVPYKGAQAIIQKSFLNRDRQRVFLAFLLPPLEIEVANGKRETMTYFYGPEASFELVG